MLGVSSVERQVFSGSCNTCESCYDVGGFNDNAFVAYACGTSVIVLRQANFERLQRIADVACTCSETAVQSNSLGETSESSATHEPNCAINSGDAKAEISCVECSTVFGKIAVSCGSRVLIYEPQFACESAASGSVRRTTRATKLDVASSTRFDGEPEYVDPPQSVPVKYVWRKKAVLAVDQDINIDADGEDERSTEATQSSGSNLYRQGAPFAAARRVVVLAFNFNGSRLLAGTRDGSLFYFNLMLSNRSKSPVTEPEKAPRECEWRCIWQLVHPDRAPFTLAHFSPDSAYFCTVNSAQRSVVGVWFGVRMHTQGSATGARTRVRFQQFTLAHPEPVVCVQWRNFNGTLVPIGAVQNVLLTITADNVCRVWSENQSLYTLNGIGPRDIDSLVDRYCDKLATFLTQFSQYVATHCCAPPRLVQRTHDSMILRKVGIKSERCLDRICAALRFDVASVKPQTQLQQKKFVSKSRANATSKRARSLFDGYNTEDIAVGMCHFHLVASVNANTDIALLSAGVTRQASGDVEPELPADGSRTPANLILNFLNNKETLFNAVLEKLFRSLNTMLGEDDSEHARGAGELDPSAAEDEDEDDEDKAERARNVRASVRHAVLNLLDGWHTAADLLVAFSPADGSLLMWTLEHLDPAYPACFVSQLPLVSAPRSSATNAGPTAWSSAGELGAVHLRQAQVSFTNRLPALMPACDARALAARVRVTNDFAYLTRNALAANAFVAASDLVQCYLLVTQHRNASLNFWQFALAADTPRDRDGTARDRERTHVQQLPRLPFASYQIHSFQHRLRLTGHADPIRAVLFAGSHQLLITHSDLALEFWRFYPPPTPGRPRTRTRFASAHLTHVASVKNRLIADTRKRFALLPCTLTTAQCFDAASLPLPAADDPESPQHSVMLMLSFEERERPAESVACASMKKLRFYALVLDARWLLDADRVQAQLVAQCPMLSEPSGSHPASVFLLRSALVDADFSLDELVFMHIYRCDQLLSSDNSAPPAFQRQSTNTTPTAASVPTSLFDSAFCLVMLTRRGRLVAYTIHVSNRRHMEARAILAGRNRKTGKFGHSEISEVDGEHDAEGESDSDVSFHVGPGPGPDEADPAAPNASAAHAQKDRASRGSTTTAIDASHQSRLLTVEVELTKLSDSQICDTSRQLVAATLAWNANSTSNGLADSILIASALRQSAIEPYQFAVIDDSSTVRCYALRLGVGGTTLDCNELAQSITLNAHCAEAPASLSITAPFVGYLVVYCGADTVRASPRANQLAFTKAREETSPSSNLHVFECLSSGGREWALVHDEAVLSTLARTTLLAPAFHHQVLTREQVLAIAGARQRNSHRLFSDASFGICAPPLRAVVAVQRNEIRVFDIEARFAAFADTIAFDHAALVDRAPLPVYHPHVLLHLSMLRDYVTLHAVLGCLQRALRCMSPDSSELRSVIAARFADKDADLDADTNDNANTPSMLTKSDLEDMRRELTRVQLASLSKQHQQELLSFLNALDADELTERFSSQAAALIPRAPQNAVASASSKVADSTDSAAQFGNSNAYDALFDAPRFNALEETLELKLDDLELDLGLDSDDAKSQPEETSEPPTSADGQAELDECGQRFALVLRQALATNSTSELGATTFVIWAFHSESQRELLELIPGMKQGEVRWPELRRFGVGWWLKDSALLRRLAEQLAACELQRNDADALDAAAYQLVLGRRALVLNWYKMMHNERMVAFWRQDFENDAAARRVALKNAYHLLSLQRPSHAIAFFLLVDAFQDALDIAVYKLADFQLALLLARLCDLNPEVRSKLTAKPIAGKYRSALAYLVSRFIIEPFEALVQRQPHAAVQTADTAVETLMRFEDNAVLASIAYWCVGQYMDSVRALVDALRTPSVRSAPDRVYHVYVYLKRHPLVQRQSTLSGKTAVSEADECYLQFQLLEQFTHQLGSPLLALLTCAEFERHAAEWFGAPSSATSRRYYEQMKTAVFLGCALQDLDSSFLQAYAYDRLIANGGSLCAPFDSWFSAFCRFAGAIMPRADRTSLQLELLSHVLRYCVSRTDSDLQLASTAAAESEAPRATCAQLEMAVRLATSAFLTDLEARSMLLRRAEISRVSGNSREREALNRLRSMAPRSSIAVALDASSLSPRVLETGPKLVKYVVNFGTGTGASATVCLGSSLIEGDYLDHLDALRHELLRAFTVFSLAVSNAETPRLRASVRVQASHISKLSESLSRCIFEALQLVTASAPHSLAPAAAVMAAAARGFVPLEGSNGLSLARSAAIKWPGVAALRAMLLLKEQAPRTGAHASHTFGEPQSNFARKFSRILMFLCECFTLLYVVRISTAVWLLDARSIQRTLARELDEASFFAIFGGAVSLQQGTPTSAQPPALQSPQSPLARATISSFDLPRTGNAAASDAPRDHSPSSRRGAPVRPPPITKQPISGAPGFSASSTAPTPSAPAQLTSAKTTTALASASQTAQSPTAAAQPPPNFAGGARRESLRAGGQPHEFFVSPTCSFNEYFSQKHRSASASRPSAQSNASSTGGNSNMTGEEQYDSDSEAAERFRAAAEQHAADLYEEDEERTTNEYTSDNSFSWLMVQFLSFVVARSRLQNFLKKVLQLELEDLNELHSGSSHAQSCCSLYVLFMHLKQFERHAAYQLGVAYPDGPPAAYYPVAAVNARIEQDRAALPQPGVNAAPPIQLRKYRLLASADFTPFQPTRCGGADPMRLWQAHVLWQTLIKQDSVGSLVSKLLCETRDSQPSTSGLPSTNSVTDLLAMLTSGAERERDDGGTPATSSASSRYVVVYRSAGEQAIHAFSVNEANITQAVVACGDKDVIELDVSSVVCELCILRKSSASFSLLRRNSDSHFSLSALWDSFDDGSSIALRDLDTFPAPDSGNEEHEAEIYTDKKLRDDAEPADSKANGRRYDKKRLRNTRLHIPARRMHRDRDRHHANRERSHKTTSQANRGGSLSALQTNKKQASSVVRCIVAHPQLPFYLTGTQDGNIQVQRFGMNERLSQLRPPNSLFPKVTKLEFTREGNRIGASDAEGAVSLWHLNVVGSAAANNQPYYSLKCHSKAAHDFTFLNSATVFATAGLASGTAAPGAAVLASSTANTTWNTLTANVSVLNGGNNMAAAGSYPQLSTTISTTNTDAHNYNVCIWDTLLHPRKALAYGVRLFDDESQNGAAVSPNASTLASDCHVLQHCPMHSLLFVGTRRGVLHCVDMRMFSECRNTVRSWYAHDAATGVKALAIDPQERCLVTGSASGEIKLWSISAINNGGTMKPLATIKRQAGTAGSDGFTIEVGESVSLTSLPSGGANAHHSASAGIKNSITQLRIPAFEPNLLFASSATGSLSIFSLNKILETNEF